MLGYLCYRIVLALPSRAHFALCPPGSRRGRIWLRVASKAWAHARKLEYRDAVKGASPR